MFNLFDIFAIAGPTIRWGIHTETLPDDWFEPNVEEWDFLEF